MMTCAVGGGIQTDRSGIRTFLLLLTAIILACLLGGRHYGDDAVVLAVFILVTGGGLRSGVGLASILAFVSAFPPLQWPLYWVCFAPLAWLWRETQPINGSWVRESFGVGFAMCWLSSPFVRGDFPKFGVLIQGLASTLFGIQMMAIAAGLRWFRNRSVFWSAPVVGLAATRCEVVRVFVLRWPLLALGFPAASTPLAQWAHYASPFGVSFLLYLINFLLCPSGPKWKTLRAWLPTLAALVCGALAWFGGERIAARVPVNPIPLSVLLVQPNRLVPASSQDLNRDGSVACLLDGLTRSALREGPPVDLIVWPETSIRRAGERLSLLGATESQTGSDEPTLNWFYHNLAFDYRTPCLVGAVVQESDGRRFNSALLITPNGQMSRYDKRILVVGAESNYTPGRNYRCLPLVTREGRDLSLGVSICYEIHFPWLPQYLAINRPDVMLHLNNESRYRDYPGQHGHGTWACQYRAIETRTWQIVCATWTRSAVIDPRGTVRVLLPAKSSTLRVSPQSHSGRGDMSCSP
jgi:apolipoprotein N-acyltransferase